MANVVITGASAGIGRALSQIIIAEGHWVLVSGRQELPLRELKASARVVGDLRETHIRAEIVREVEAQGPLDFLINCAGFSRGCPLERDDNLVETIQVNVIALAQLTQALLPQLKRSSHGRVMNIGSGFGIIAFPMMTSYVASKYAVTGFTKALYLDLAKTPVSASVYCPARVRTHDENPHFSSSMKYMARLLSDSPETMARAIWKRRHTTAVVVFPTWVSTLAWIADWLPDRLYLGTMRFLLRRTEKSI